MSSEQEHISEKLLNAYMKTAYCFASCSSANRLKVGAIMVKDQNIISFSYNGTPSGYPSNCCEDSEGNTLPEVIHAESNLLMKVAKSNYSSINSTVFCTHSPCFQCAKLLLQAGIKQLYFSEYYRCSDGLFFLENNGVKVTHFSLSTKN